MSITINDLTENPSLSGTDNMATQKPDGGLQNYKNTIDDLVDFIFENPLSPEKGGTGIDNGSYTITLEGNLSTWGPSSEVPADVTFRMVGDTVVTFTASGNISPLLVNQSGAQLNDLQLRSAVAPLVFSTSGSENAIVVNYMAPSGTGPRSYTIPDIGEDANFLLGKTQTTVSASWEGMWSPPRSENYFCTRIEDQVFIDLQEMMFNADAASTIYSVAAIPEGLRPAVTKSFVIRVVDNNDSRFGLLSIDSSGNIIIAADANGGSFSGDSNEGPSGFVATGIRYFI